MCNQYYFYVVDEDFGPLFIKFSSYFPYTACINLNGHKFAKRQLALLEMNDFLPRQTGAAIDLRAHQNEAHDWLSLICLDGITIALLEHATGTGKTITAIEDAKRVGGPVFYIPHRENLVHSPLPMRGLGPPFHVKRLSQIRIRYNRHP